MPITLLFYLACIVIVAVLIANLAYPFLNPRYRLFWMFRKDRYLEASRRIEEAETSRDVREMEKAAKAIESEEEK